MFCQKCGKEIPDGSIACNYCGVSFAPLPNLAAATDPKRADVITAKIATKRQQIEDISQIGPSILIGVGIVICIFLIFMLYAFLFGLILIGIGVWWSNCRNNEGKRLRNEIKELEAELG